MQLELARRNSRNQHGKDVPSLPLDVPVEATIYEEEPYPARPLSRAPRDSHSQRSAAPRPESTMPTQALESPLHRSERCPLGPRSPSPLPPPKTPPPPPATEFHSMDFDFAERTSYNPPRSSTALSQHQGLLTSIPRNANRA
ncbi:hypothetical protein Hypma_006979 [Hypsizygus marmoreus]|uniref:Uncharacterized protein n=1 Tax=Hypsizygus marmoreus TaxID=39966 RepID=A0A369K1R3_HYPMA|nr:hypothetical protein Hypma_006979 [Hypsizygus marmoreus]